MEKARPSFRRFRQPYAVGITGRVKPGEATPGPEGSAAPVSAPQYRYVVEWQFHDAISQQAHPVPDEKDRTDQPHPG